MTAAVQCVACERFTLRESPNYAELGLGRCSGMTDRSGSFVSPSYRRRCPDHQPAHADKAAARIEWLRELRSEGA